MINGNKYVVSAPLYYRKWLRVWKTKQIKLWKQSELKSCGGFELGLGCGRWDAQAGCSGVPGPRAPPAPHRDLGSRHLLPRALRTPNGLFGATCFAGTVSLRSLRGGVRSQAGFSARSRPHRGFIPRLRSSFPLEPSSVLAAGGLVTSDLLRGVLAK